MKTVSILIPLFNEAENLEELHERITKVVNKLKSKYEFTFIFIDDGSTDESMPILQKLAKKDKRIRVISLSRNFGKEAAMLAGFDHTNADAVVLMDADLQHPPEVIPDMLKKWEEGYRDVYGERSNRKGDNIIRRAAAALYYKILQSCVRYKVYRDIGDFRLLDHSCVEAIRQVRESSRSIKNIFSWIGFKKIAIPYEVAPRTKGKTKWSLTKLINLAMDGFTAFTTMPLRLAGWLGAIMIAGTAIAVLWLGIATSWSLTSLEKTLAVVVFLSGVQLSTISILGTYLGRVFVEAKARPVYLVEQYVGEGTRVVGQNEEKK